MLVGPNGAGKTAVLEAVLHLATGSSHRTSADAVLVRHGAETATAQGRVVQDDRLAVLERQVRAGGARVRLDGRAVRPREVAGLLRAVLASPEDLELVRGEPAVRRRLWDDLAVARRPTVAGARADVERALRQRAQLLRSARAVPRAARPAALATLEAWDAQLLPAAAELVRARLDVLAEVAGPVAEAAAGLGLDPLVLRPHLSWVDDEAVGPDDGPAADEGEDEGRAGAALAVPRPDEVEGLLAAALERRRDVDLDRGATTVGPHRDDLLLELGGGPARTWASQGQARGVALALRLGSHRLLGDDGREAVLLLDDVFADLDVLRRERLAERCAATEQVLLTATDATGVVEGLHARTWQVEVGGVEPSARRPAG